jgi:murein DD-endopeptidase MepM/ murein hydrolase activator NlpD
MGTDTTGILKRLFAIHENLSVDVGSKRWFAQSGVLGMMGAGLVGLGMVSPDMMNLPSAATLPTEAVITSEPAPQPQAQTLAIAEIVIAPEPSVPEPLLKSVTIGQGDTLARVLDTSGVGQKPAFLAIQALSKNFDVRKLQVGQTVNLVFDGEQQDQLLELRIKPEVDKIVTTSRNDDGKFYSQVEILPLEKVMQRASGRIDNSLYMAMDKAGVAPEVIADLIMIFSFDVDFQREIREGDGFDLYYEQYLDDAGQVTKHGTILHGSLTLRGKPINLYHYVTSDDGRYDYYNEKGHSVRKALLRTPIDGARLTSRFGRRRHPVLGYTKMHRGADFGARRGTPIRAAGDGVIQRASRFGSFGKYVRIRHSGEFETAYAHMKGYAKGVRKGAKVKQGQIIGYVGTTGRSTGPHLHYEVHKNGKQVNPMGLKLPSGRKLNGPELASFQAMLLERKVAIAATPAATQVATTN